MPDRTVHWKFRATNALRDLADRLAGRCCAAPRYMADGGYHFWRCGLRRGHPGPHRSRNYLWGPGGSAYDPAGGITRGVDRKPVETRRQRRERLRWQQMDDAKRRLSTAHDRAGEERDDARGVWCPACERHHPESSS